MSVEEQEALNKVLANDVYAGRKEAVLKIRQKKKMLTLESRKKWNLGKKEEVYMKRKVKIVKVLLVIFILFGIVEWLQAEALESIFNSTSTQWKSKCDPAEFTELNGHTGYKFPCDFSKVEGRCSWDVGDLKIDLSKVVSISAWVHVENAAMIESIIIYFKSGKGWYYIAVPAKDGWEQITRNVDDFVPEGETGSLDKIDGIKVSVWEKGDEHATVTICEMKCDFSGDKEAK